MSTATGSVHEDPTALRREIDRLKSDLERLRFEFSGLVDDAARVAKAGTAEARQQVKDQVSAAAETGRESVEAVERQVAAHPVMAIATAFAVGMVVGLGLTRKD